MKIGALFITTIFLLLIIKINAQQIDSTTISNPKSLSQIFGKYTPFYCDSATYTDLVVTIDWLNLPLIYKFENYDTIISKKIKCNIRIRKAGQIIAYGSIDKKKRPCGLWEIKSNITNPLPEEYFCIWGQMKKGIKKKRWQA
ncbi:MAG: hypothetical protein ACXVDV_21020, partial [Bacteroidia bacterium]